VKIEQTPKFQPITITLETASEAEVLWAVSEAHVKNLRNKSTVLTDEEAGQHAFCISLANKFSELQLGG